MNTLQDFKEQIFAVIVFLLSFIDTPFKTAQWVFFIISVAFTLRRWYLMEKKNNNN
jgi:hypothetical protein